MTDSLTQSDIDRIYGRLTEDVDLVKIKTKNEFKKAIKEAPKTRQWNKKLNDFFWDIHTQREEIIEEVEEIEELPTIPREKLTPTEKRKQTLERKKLLIDIKASPKQKAYRRRKPRRWEKVEIKFAQGLRQDGLTYKQIAEQLERTPSSVSTKLLRMKGG